MAVLLTTVSGVIVTITIEQIGHLMVVGIAYVVMEQIVRIQRGHVEVPKLVQKLALMLVGIVIIVGVVAIVGIICIEANVVLMAGVVFIK
jgi:hypothetical protein